MFSNKEGQFTLNNGVLGPSIRRHFPPLRPLSPVVLRRLRMSDPPYDYAAPHPSDGAQERDGPRSSDGPEATALYDAATAGNVDAIAALLVGGADVHAVDHRGETPLHHAAHTGTTATIAALLAAGADVAALDEQQRPPLHLAALCAKLSTSSSRAVLA